MQNVMSAARHGLFQTIHLHSLQRKTAPCVFRTSAVPGGRPWRSQKIAPAFSAYPPSLAVTENCSCIFCIPAIPGGKRARVSEKPDDCMDAGGRQRPEQVVDACMKTYREVLMPRAQDDIQEVLVSREAMDGCSDCAGAAPRRYGYREVPGRVEPGAETESNARSSCRGILSLQQDPSSLRSFGMTKGVIRSEFQPVTRSRVRLSRYSR